MELRRLLGNAKLPEATKYVVLVLLILPLENVWIM